ncbi:MAG: ABC transporter ATP-binding protein [Candidatus Poribacteria bacterium]|nr:ABC transporter ATP-binding protein [Candidatus Poribacteria bacterium]
MNSLIRVVGLHKSYYDGLTELPVLKGIDLEVQRAEMLAIVGASGVGKSTLLHLIGALDRPTSGKVYYEEQDAFAFSDRELDRFRNQEIGFVFQFHHLLPEFTALENVAMGALIARQQVDVAYDRARELLDYVGLAERLEHRPYELSGGERQRVAIARALVNSPKVVLADELTGNLDRKTSEAVHDLLWDLNDRLGQTFIIVTHNQPLAQRADRLIHLVDGRVSDQVHVLDF